MNRPFQLTAVALSASLLTACGGGGGGGSTATIDIIPDAPLTAAALVTSTESLALVVSGTARRITVSNKGELPIMALQATATGLPEGSSMQSDCPDNLEGAASCSLLITPGATPSAAPGNPPAVPAMVQLTSSNTPSIDVQVTVLTYGSLYQGGYVFALNDGTPVTGSAGGKVLATVETANAHWSPTPLDIAGVNEDSVSSTGACNGAIDGQCNTARILAQYPTGSRDFAAGLCADSRHSGFADWYLPAICEMGYDSDGLITSLCGTQAAPRLADNVTSRLFDQGPVGHFWLAYWTSTQASVNPMSEAHVAVFGGGRPTTALAKQVGMLPSKCARAITN